MPMPTILPTGQLHPDLFNGPFVKRISSTPAATGEPPDKVHIVDIPVTEDLIFTEGSVLLCGAEQKIGFAVKEAVRSSARGCGFICILSSVDRRVDSFDDEAHPFVLYDGFAVIVIGGRGSSPTAITLKPM